MTTFCIFKPGSCPFLRRLRRHLSRRVNKLSMTASLHLRLFILIAAFLRFTECKFSCFEKMVMFA